MENQEATARFTDSKKEVTSILPLSNGSLHLSFLSQPKKYQAPKKRKARPKPKPQSPPKSSPTGSNYSDEEPTLQDKKLPIPQFGVLPQTEEDDTDPKATRRRRLRETRASRIPTKPANYTGKDTVISGLKRSKQGRQRKKKPSPPTPKNKQETSQPDPSQPAKTTTSNEIGKLQSFPLFPTNV